VVLRGDGSVLGSSTAKLYHGQYCDIAFPANGALHAGTSGTKGLSHVDFEPNPSTACGNSTPVRYKLEKDGNFFFRCANLTTDYNTHSNQGGIGSYFMAIDDHCELHIFKGTFGCDATDIQQEVWSSHKFGSWGIDERLYKGQVYEGLSPYHIVMAPSGVLEVRTKDANGVSTVVWKSNVNPGSNDNDFYAKLTAGGRLILVGIDYPGMVEKEYYAKALSGASTCYTLGYKTSPFDLIAVKC
jgi:hypothetical protein